MTWSHLFTDPRARELYENWKSAVLSTAPVDEGAARAAIVEAYRALQGHDPKFLLFFESPQQAIFALGRTLPAPKIVGAAGLAHVISRHVAGQSIGGIHAALSRLVRNCLVEPVSLAIRHHTALTNNKEVIADARERLRVQMPSRKARAAVAGLDVAPETAFDPGPSIGWLAQQAYLVEVAPACVTRTYSALSARLEALCRAAPWMWLFAEGAIFSDRPDFVAPDMETASSSFSGLALRFRDGFEVQVSPGRRVPSWLLDAPHLITPRHIERETNAEVRRLLLERMGISRYLAESGAIKVKVDSTGTLWRREFTRDEGGRSVRMPLCFVEVVNGTPEPDGSYRHYFLRVPPWMRTARQAVAWTYGLDERAYRPLIRT